MATDVLILGDFEFLGFEVPDKIPFGGKQSAQVHKLPGGARVIDTLGPDDLDVSWSGKFYSDDAMDRVLTLDAMRRSGEVVGLSYAGYAAPVIVTEFVAEWVRYPVLAEYKITLTVASTGEESPAGVDAQIGADIEAAGGDDALSSFVDLLDSAGPVRSAPRNVMLHLRGQASALVAAADTGIGAQGAIIEGVAPLGLSKAAAIKRVAGALEAQIGLVESRGYLGRIMTNLAGAI